MRKKYQNKNVLEASAERMEFLFSHFEQIIVSFSGGKDSGVLLNLAYDFAKKTNQLHKLAMYHMDYEAQYQATTDYVTEAFNSFEGIKKYWVCLPIKAQCSTSMFQNYWQPWKVSEKEIWCRNLPQNSINEQNHPFDFDCEVSDYEFNVKFAKWISKDKLTCFLIGIRTQESLHRYKAIAKFSDKNEFKSKSYTSIVLKNCYNAYPIYDWETEDIWIANAKFRYTYNKLYDLMYQAGLGVHEMRVASPFNDCAAESLKLYKVLDPNNWGKLIGRVNGVNFTAIYGGTSAMGWRNISKPQHFTWKQYMYFLLDTLPAETKEHYLKKLHVSFAYWLEKGGALPSSMVNELNGKVEFEDMGVPINNRAYSKDYKIVKFKEYLEEIDIKNPNLLPTYKRMCIAIMKNDTSCKTLGFGQTKEELKKRQDAIKKYQSIL